MGRVRRWKRSRRREMGERARNGGSGGVEARGREEQERKREQVWLVGQGGKGGMRCVVPLNHSSKTIYPFCILPGLNLILCLPHHLGSHVLFRPATRWTKRSWMRGLIIHQQEYTINRHSSPTQFHITCFYRQSVLFMFQIIFTKTGKLRARGWILATIISIENIFDRKMIYI